MNFYFYLFSHPYSCSFGFDHVLVLISGFCPYVYIIICRVRVKCGSKNMMIFKRAGISPFWMALSKTIDQRMFSRF